MRALVLVKLTVGKERDFLRAAKKLESVRRAVLTTGRFDAAVEVEAESFEALVEQVLEKLRKLKGVKETETLLEVE